MMARGERESDSAVERLFEDGRTNALASWLVVGILALVLAESLLDIDWLWMSFVATAGTIILVPPVVYREWRVMLPWELLALVVIPMLGSGLLSGGPPRSLTTSRWRGSPCSSRPNSTCSQRWRLLTGSRCSS